MDQEAATDFFKKALFIIAAGSNDILEYVSPSVPFFGREKPDPSYFQDALVSNLTFYLKVLPVKRLLKFSVDCSYFETDLHFIFLNEEAKWTGG
jgi:hypothetical protein